jgi:hypothetical protein
VSRLILRWPKHQTGWASKHAHVLQNDIFILVVPLVRPENLTVNLARHRLSIAFFKPNNANTFYNGLASWPHRPFRS